MKYHNVPIQPVAADPYWCCPRCGVSFDADKTRHCCRGLFVTREDVALLHTPTPPPTRTREEEKRRLQQRLAQIEAEEAAERDAAWQARKVFLLKHISDLLRLLSSHDGHECTSYRITTCPRCRLLDIRDAQTWPDDLDLRIELVSREGDKA